MGKTGSEPGNIIEVGGVDLAPFTQRIKITSEPGDLTKMHLDLVNLDLMIDAKIDTLAMDEATKAFIQIVATAIKKNVEGA